MPKLLRITTVPISLRLLLTGQMKYMQANGFEVLMASADGPERALVIQAENTAHHIIPFTRAITPIQDLKCLWQLILWMRKERPDIVHTHTPKAGLLGMLAARITGVPVRIHTIAGLPFMTIKGGKRKLLIAMEKLTYWGAHQVWPNSKSMLAYVQEQNLCPAHKLDIISEGSTNGIDLERFSPTAIQADLLAAVKQSFNYQEGLTYLMAIGRVVKDKGIPELIEAFTALQEEYPDIRLLLVGPLEEERAEELLPANCLENIHHHPAIQHIQWTDQVAYFLHLADVLVHASHREGFPNVPLQAAAMQCPIVCSAIPGNIDIVENAVTGLTFPVGDVTALKTCLESVLNDKETAKERALELRTKIEQSFDRKVIHQALLDRYKALLTAKSL